MTRDHLGRSHTRADATHGAAPEPPPACAPAHHPQPESHRANADTWFTFTNLTALRQGATHETTGELAETFYTRVSNALTVSQRERVEHLDSTAHRPR